MLLTVSNKEGSKNTVSDQTCSNISKCHLINSEVLGSYIRRYFKREDKLLVATSSGGASTSSSCLPINIIHDCLSKIVLGANVHYIEKDERSCKAMRKRFKKKGTDLKLERNSLSKVGRDDTAQGSGTMVSEGWYADSDTDATVTWSGVVWS